MILESSFIRYLNVTKDNRASLGGVVIISGFEMIVL